MNNCCVKVCLMLAMAASLLHVRCDESATELADVLFATSNAWGTAVSVYESSVLPLVDTVSTNASCAGSVVEW